MILVRYGNSCSVWGPRRDWGERKGGRAGQSGAGQGRARKMEETGRGRQREREIEEDACSVIRRAGVQIGGVRGKRREGERGSERRGAKQMVG